MRSTRRFAPVFSRSRVSRRFEAGSPTWMRGVQAATRTMPWRWMEKKSFMPRTSPGCALRRDLPDGLLKRFRRLGALDHVLVVDHDEWHAIHALPLPEALAFTHLGAELVARQDRLGTY